MTLFRRRNLAKYETASSQKDAPRGIIIDRISFCLAGIDGQSTLARMKIFISMKAIRSDVQLASVASALDSAIRTQGHEPFIATQEIANKGMTSPQAFMPFVREHLATCDLCIVIYHPELRGGLIEAGIAYERRIPIWLCHKADEKVSSSMLGCADVVLTYNDVNDLQEKIKEKFTSLRTK